jgi:hypothetical protein
MGNLQQQNSNPFELDKGLKNPSNPGKVKKIDVPLNEQGSLSPGSQGGIHPGQIHIDRSGGVMFGSQTDIDADKRNNLQNVIQRSREELKKNRE